MNLGQVMLICSLPSLTAQRTDVNSTQLQKIRLRLEVAESKNNLIEKTTLDSVISQSCILKYDNAKLISVWKGHVFYTGCVLIIYL